MSSPFLIDTFLDFGIAVLLGFVIGLERQKRAGENHHAGIRDFVLFALIGAVSGSLALSLDSVWVLATGFAGFIALLLSGFWADVLRDREGEPGITTELAAVVTFFLGVLVVHGTTAVAIAIAIVVFATLSQAEFISRFQRNVRSFELDAALKLLVITFIVLPVLPHKSLDQYFTVPLGTVTAFDSQNSTLKLKPASSTSYEAGEEVRIYSPGGTYLGDLEVFSSSRFELSGRYSGDAGGQLRPESDLRAEFGLGPVSVMLSAIKPYNVWLIVILVSFISFVGYVLVKVFGSSAGIGLTGLVGGLASSTVTTLSFARRSKESPALNQHFAVAIILASTVMFPRLLMQVAVVNHQLMSRMAVPVLMMAASGVLVAGWYYLRGRKENPETESLRLSNPFSLKSALSFALVFAAILMVTRLAITYLGGAWLPLVALVSGLTDADAIAFSVSDAQRDGLISLDWAAFNAVLGAIANTFMKLILVFTLGDRGLFRKLLVAVTIIGTTGLVSAFVYYDLSVYDAPGDPARDPA